MSNGLFPPQLYQPEELLYLEGLEPQQSHGVMKPSSELVLLVRPEPSRHYAPCPLPCCSMQGHWVGKNWALPAQDSFWPYGGTCNSPGTSQVLYFFLNGTDELCHK